MAEVFDGRRALVTGGSRGIGAAIALELAERGAHIAIVCRSPGQSADETAARVRERGVTAEVFGCDLSVPEEVSALGVGVADNFGDVDILVNNAGIAETSTLADIGVADWDRTLNTNLRSAFLMSQLFSPGMATRRWGRILLVSSVAAFTGGVVGAHYAASKAGMHGLTHSLAQSLAPDGVTVNALAPAFVPEGATLPMGEGAEDRYRQKIPLDRLIDVTSVAAAAADLLGNGSITSQTLSVDGGAYPR